jgi:hypothetical protein
VQVIFTIFFAAALVAEALGVALGVGSGDASCDNFTLIVGDENVNPFAER